MRLFSRIPDRFFSILVSPNKELYVQALFVLRQAFKTELVIRSEDLAAMLMDSLESDMSEADFTEEYEEEAGRTGDYHLESTDSEGGSDLSGKAHLILRRLKATGWIETEYETDSFEENITIPDYAVPVMNLLYDLSSERVREYNSYVYATYAALANASENPDYTYQALAAAYQNTVSLIDELKTLFNNIRRYYRRIPVEDDVNVLLAEHFDEYRAKLVDTIYYPLKTIDSVPRFKHAILAVLNGWMNDPSAQDRIILQGISRHIFEDEESGREETLRMMNYISDTYDGIEDMLDEIDRKHNEYINASIEHIRYLMNSDRGVKGKIIELLKHSADERVADMMIGGVNAYRHQYLDRRSMFNNVKRTRRSEGKPMALPETKTQEHEGAVESFLEDVRRQYTNKKIDAYIYRNFGDGNVFSSEEALMEDPEDFILFMLGTLRGREKSAGYTVEFPDDDNEDNIINSGASLPRAIFRKKTGNV